MIISKAPGLLVAAAIAIAVSACAEKLESVAGCPDLCSGQGGAIQTLTIEPVILDTTISVSGEFGTDAYLLVGSRGDTLDTRPVIRFDSVPSRFARAAGDSASITTVDSAFLTVRVDRRGSILPGIVIVDAYDVDAVDANLTDVRGLFTPDRLIGTLTVPKDSLKDTVRIRLSNATVLARAQSRGRLRIGLRARTASTQFGIAATESSQNTHVTFRVTTDTAVRPIFLTPKSSTPADNAARATASADYTIAVKTAPLGPASGINIGGYPARLSYLRFTIPKLIVDSSIVVRARLILTQIPNTDLGPADTVVIIPLVGAAAATVTDISRAATVTLERGSALIDSLIVPVNQGGQRKFEIAVALQAWRLQSALGAPQVLVLRSGAEGVAIAEGRFYSMEAAPNLRPKLEISYTPRTSFGLP